MSTRSAARRFAGITSLAAALALAAPAIEAMPLDAGLQGYWSFDGSALDLSGNGRDLTLNGAPSFTGGVSGQGLGLPGNESVSASRAVDDDVFDFGGGDFTIQIWVDFDQIAGEQTLIEKFEGPGGNGWTLTKLATNEVHFFASSGAIALTTSGTGSTLSDPGFHQVVMRRAGATFDVFLDGTSFATASSAAVIADTANPLLLGARDNIQNFPVSGVLDEVGIWTRALSVSEVETLFNGGQSLSPLPAPVPEPSLALLVAGVVCMLARTRRRPIEG